MAQSVANYSVTRSTGITYNSIISTGNSFASWRYTGFFSALPSYLSTADLRVHWEETGPITVPLAETMKPSLLTER